MCALRSDLTYADNSPNNDGNKCVLLLESIMHRVLTVHPPLETISSDPEVVIVVLILK